MMSRTWLLLAFGGTLGAASRWAIGELGWSTVVTLILVNTVGALLLGVLVARRQPAHHRARLAIGVGFCGGLTTFSGLAVETVQRLDGTIGSAIGFVTVSVVLGVAGFVGGHHLAGGR